MKGSGQTKEENYMVWYGMIMFLYMRLRNVLKEQFINHLIYFVVSTMKDKSTVIKKKYRPKDSNNQSYSTISINDSIDLAESSVAPQPSKKRFEVHDLSSYTAQEEQPPAKTYKFEYSFNQYLRLFLIKLLPLKEDDMAILPAENTLKGPQAKCQKLLKNIKNQLERYSVKIVKYNLEADIEQITYHTDQKYNTKIYKPKFLELTTKDLTKYYGFKEQSAPFLKRITSEQIILVRVEKKDQQECINLIKRLMAKEENNSTATSASTSNRKREDARQAQGRYEQTRTEREDRDQRREYREERDFKKQKEKPKPKPQPKQPTSSSSEQIVEEEDGPTFYQSQKGFAKNTSKSEFRQASQANFRKMEEPTQDDSISVVGQKRQKDKYAQNQRYSQKNERRYSEEKRYSQEKRGRGNWDRFRKGEERRYQEGEREAKPNKQAKKLRLITEYEYQDLDEKTFSEWLQKCKQIPHGYVKIVSKEDRYTSGILTHSLQLYCQEDADRKRQDELVEALEVYLKFRKVVLFKLQNERYKEQLIQKFEQSSESLTVKYIKGYKSSKWSDHNMWKYVVNKSYTQEKKSNTNIFFQLFFLEGLKNSVVETEKEIKDSLQKEPKGDESEELIIKFIPEISDHLRNNKKLQDLIKEYAQKLVSGTYSHCCSISSVQFPLSNLKLTLSVKSDQLQNFQKTVSVQIKQKIQSEITIQQFPATFQIDKHTYSELQKVAVITHREDKKFKYVSSIYGMADLIQKMNNLLHAQNKIGERELKVADKITAKLLEEKISQLMKKSDYSEIKHNYVSDQSRFRFYGRQYHLNNLIKQLSEYITEIDEKRINYFQIAKRREGQILQKDGILKDLSTKYEIVISVNQTEIPCKFILNGVTDLFKKKNILIVKSKSLDHAPCGSIIAFRSLAEVDLFKGSYFMKTFRNYINKHKSQVFIESTRKYTIMIKQSLGAAEILREALTMDNPSNHIVMVMPENGKEAYVKAIIKELLENKNIESKQTTVMIVQFGQSADLMKQLSIPPYVKGKKLQLKDQRLRKYYVEDKGAKYYYSESGNSKILQASQKGFNKVILNNDDLNILHVSHSFYPQQLALIHLQSNKQFPVKINNTKVEFTLKNQAYEAPPAQAANMINAINTNNPKIDISLGVYEIDLTTMKQINLFSDYERQLHFEEILIKADINQEQIQAFYNLKAAEIQYSYYFDDGILNNFNLAQQSIVSFLQNCLKNKEISYKQFKNIEAVDHEAIKSLIQEDQQTECIINTTNKIISIRALDQTTINRWEKMIEMTISNLNKREPSQIKLPTEWQPQKNDIQTFEVNKTTQQFADVQKLFTMGQIKSLHRIQNKIIYKKYYEQGLFLQSLNGGKKVKTMRLFHGTRATNPEEIYKDKEQSFNINYSSDNNLLGKGIYFAQRSEYSNSYRYTQVVNTGNILGIVYGAANLYSMFLCEVLVGESQKCPGHSGGIKDTAYKDPLNKIKYESMTDYLNNSNIFVVYKSRRAYPLYLIKY